MNQSDSHLEDNSPRSLELAHSFIGDEDAPRVLILHGITASRNYWLPRSRPALEGHRALIPDLPGFGLSPKPVTTYNLPFFAEAIHGLLERVGWADQPVKVLGHSLGTLIGLELAASYPHLVSKLVLLSLPRYRDRAHAHEVMMAGSTSYRSLLTVNSLRANLSQMRRTGLGLTARSLSRFPLRVLADARRFTFRSLSSTLEHCLMHYSVEEVVDRLPTEIPVRLVHGEADQVAQLPLILEILDRFPDVTLDVMPKAGHHPLHTHTKMTNARLKQALAAL